MGDSQPATVIAEPGDSRSRLASDAALIGVAFIWGINIPIMKTGLGDLNLYVFNGIRLTISAAALNYLAWLERRRNPQPLPGVGRGQLLIYGLVVSAAYQLLFLLGVVRTTSGNTALILTTTPLWTAVLARFYLAEKLRIVAWSGLFVALVGTVIVTLQGDEVSLGSEQLWGNLLILVSALTWAAGTVHSRPLMTKTSPLQLAAAATLIGLPFHWIFAAGHLEASLTALRSSDIWLILVFSGLLSSGLALPLWNYGVRSSGAAPAAVVQNLVPVFAIAAAWLLRGEPVTIGQVIGGILITGGVLAMRRERMSPHVGSDETQ